MICHGRNNEIEESLPCVAVLRIRAASETDPMLLVLKLNDSVRGRLGEIL